MFKTKSKIFFRAREDDPVVVQEHIASQVVMSKIDPEVMIRDHTGRDQDEDVAYEKLTTSRIDSHNTSRRSEDILGDMISRPVPRLPAADESSGSSKTTLTRLLKKIYDHIEQIRYGIQKDTYRRCVNNEWLLVGTLMDKMLFIAYFSIVIICTTVIFREY